MGKKWRKTKGDVFSADIVRRVKSFNLEANIDGRKRDYRRLRRFDDVCASSQTLFRLFVCLPFEYNEMVNF